jgi:hypothetical protein
MRHTLLILGTCFSALLVSTNVCAQPGELRQLTYSFQKGSRIILVSVIDSSSGTSGLIMSEDPTRNEHAPDYYRTERWLSVSRPQFDNMWSAITANSAQKFAQAKNDRRYYDLVNNYVFTIQELSGLQKNYVVPKDKASSALATLATQFRDYAKDVLVQTTAPARKVTGAEIVEYGLLRKVKPKGGFVDLPNSLAGKAHKGVASQLVKKTGTIKASIGTTFGIGLRFLGEPEGAVVTSHLRWIHPTLTDPASHHSSDVNEWEGTFHIADMRYVSHTFDQEWELVPGKWTIQAVYGGKVLAEKTFDVSRP